MEIQYIANNGFLIKTGDKNILIDALFGGFESDWCVTPTGEIIEKMETSTSPFDRIDVILISHAHIDHFNKEIVLKHLVSNETGILICPEQVKMELENDKRFDMLSARVMEITPENNTVSQTIEIDGVKILVWRLVHSAYYIEDEETKKKINKHENVQNLGFTIEIDRKKIFHGGDWEYDSPGNTINPLDHEKMDVAFLGIGAYLRLFGPVSRKIDASMKPDHIILMHLPPDMNDLTIEEKSSTSDAIVFTLSMETRVFYGQGTESG